MARYHNGMDYAEQWNRNRVDWLYRLARAENLGSNAVRVGLLFGTFLQPEEREEVRPGYDWLMKNARLRGRATLAKALAELETAGYIVIHRMHRYRSAYSMPFDGNGPWHPETLSSKNELIDIWSCSFS